MEKKKNLLIISLCVIVVLLLSILAYLLFFDKKVENKPCETCQKCEEKTTECNCANANTCTKAGVAGEQMLFSEMGIVYISENGEVYFDPEGKVINGEGEKINILDYAKKTFGNPKKYDVGSNRFFEEKHTFGYKLDISGVRSVIEAYFGNGGVYLTLVFVHNNGNISELTFNGSSLKLHKNISGYNNIVAAVVDHDEAGSAVRLYDKCGNGIFYPGAEYINN